MPGHDLDFLTTNYRRLSPAGYSLLQRLAVERARALRAEFLRTVWREFLSWNERRVGLAQLRALDDAALKDIGLHRSGIEAAVFKEPIPPAPQQRRASPGKPHLLLRTG